MGGLCVFFFQAEDGIRDLVRSRGLGDVYKRQGQTLADKLADLRHEQTSLPVIESLELVKEIAQGLSLIHI